MKYFLIFLASFFCAFLSLPAPKAIAQCGTFPGDVEIATHTDVSCFGANDGTITVDLFATTTLTAPYNYELYDLNLGALVTATVTETEDVSNRSVVYTNVPPGNYTVRLYKAGCPGNPRTIVEMPAGEFIIAEPLALTITLNSVDPDCNPVPAVGNGEIDISVTDGVAPYLITWTGPTAIPDGTLVASNLDAGAYTVDVEDANGCLTSLNINVPITTQADAGPPTALVCGTNSLVLSANAAGAGEIGTWSGPPGVTFSNVNDPTATVTNLNVGLNTLTWTIQDIGLICPGTSDNISVNYSDVQMTGTPDVLLDCFGDTDATGIFTVTGGSANYTYSIITNTSGATIVLPPPGPTMVVPFSNGGAGVVTLQVLDGNGCTSQATINITQPASAVTAPFTQVNVSCFGGNDGSITVTPAGGVGPYDFSIDGGVTFPITNVASHTFTSLTANTYNIQVRDANNCLSVVVPVTITQPASAVTAPFTQVNVSCFGGNDGSITVTPAGGVGPYDFSIDGGATFSVLDLASNTFNTLAAGTYNIQVRDANNCLTSIVPVTIIQPAQPVSAVLSGNAAICVGQSATLTVTFADATGPTWDFVYSDGSSTFNLTANSNPFTFNVNPVITTTYSLVSVTDATCGAGTVSGVATVTVNPIPGDQVTFGNETWIGYVYDDSSSPFPPSSDIGFTGAKYRGYIEAADIDNMSASSTYEVPLDTFDMNLGTAQIFGPNVCGTYANDFSVRYKMRKTFVAGVYTFTVGADDGVRLFVDGVNVITDPLAFFIHSYTEYTSAPICLTAGTHDLVIEYFERGTDARISFTYAMVPPPTLTTTTPLDVCVNSATPTLSVSSTDPLVIDFNWYTDAALTNLVFTGANYTPAVTELDMAAVGTSDFFVTAVYTGGCESPSNTILVNVVNGASLTLPATDVCESGGVVDLTTIVSASPSGGTFTFTGTGVTGNNFDPASLSGLVAISVDYSVGGCSAPTGTLNLTVTNTASITVPGTAIQACETAGTIDLLTLVSGTPGGGVFTFSGPQVTGNTFDPTGLSGLQTILVDYNAGGCAAPQAQFNIDVSSTASLTITNSNVCQNGGPVNLLSYVSATPSGGVFSFSGTGVTGNTFNPIGLTGPISISVTYTGVCNASGTLVLTVLDPSNPLCGGGGVNCNVFTVTISDTRPSCALQDDGTITITVSGGVPNYVVTLSAPGFSQALPGPAGNFVFSNLSPNNYQYTILDLNGNTCTLPYSLPIQTNVDADASGFVDVACFGEAVGQATLTVNSGGSAPYEYSLDGATWISFTSPHTITNLPPNGSYSILVRDDATDQCPDQVPVTINNINPRIQGLFNVTNATCNGNDGAIEITSVSGGISGPYSFKVDNGATETALPFTFTGLSGGGHLVTLIDNSGCERDTVINVSFPGFVTYSAPAITVDATCTTKGMISIFIPNPPGSYEAGYTTDPINEPVNYSPGFYNPATGLVTIPDLNAGTYYVWLRTPSAACATRFENSPGVAAIVINGPQSISFEVGCRSYDAGVTSYSVLQLNNISASSSDPLHYEIFGNGFQKSGDVTPDPLNQDTIRAFPTGDFVIWLWQNQTLFGCTVYSDTLEAPAGVLDTLSVTVTESFPEQPTGSMNIKISESGSEPYQLWLENDPFLSDTLQPVRNPITFEVSFTSLAAGTYTLYLEDATSCRRSYEVVVPFDGDIFIPNVFTPNNDGMNENFYVRNLPSSGSKLSITNRWGKEVFSSGNYNPDNLWDGGDSPDGVYYYRLQIKDGGTYTGWVEIMRGTKP
ncbi:MAG: gliding motility-associated C-terminal domain-containing protein [Cyclobacteriaceae bacterium]